MIIAQLGKHVILLLSRMVELCKPDRSCDPLATYLFLTRITFGVQGIHQKIIELMLIALRINSMAITCSFS